MFQMGLYAPYAFVTSIAVRSPVSPSLHSNFVRPSYLYYPVSSPRTVFRTSRLCTPLKLHDESRTVPSLSAARVSPRSSRTTRLKTILTVFAASFLPFFPRFSASLLAHASPCVEAEASYREGDRRTVASVTLIRPTASNSKLNRSSLEQDISRVSNTRHLSPIRIRAFLPMPTDPLSYKLLKVALLGLIVSLLVIVSAISVMFVIQDSLVYKPTKVWRGNPAASGMPYYDDVDFTTRDGVRIKGWFIRQHGDSFASARTLIYFHGTDKNASFRLAKVIGLYTTCKCNILLISYRGYGISSGRPNERGVRIDAESAYDYLVSRRDVDVGPGGNLWVYGESLGGAVAIYFSKIYQDRINALILENTFTSLLDMIKLEIPILGVFRYLSLNRWQSKKRIGHLSIPLLFLSGLKDSYIPPRMMKQMHSLATKSPLKEFIEFENGTHNRTWTSQGFYQAISTFMDRVERETKSKTNGFPFQTSVSSPVSSGGNFDEHGRMVTTS